MVKAAAQVRADERANDTSGADDPASWNVFVAKKCPGYVENGWFTKKTKRDFFNLVRAKKKKKDNDVEDEKAGSSMHSLVHIRST